MSDHEDMLPSGWSENDLADLHPAFAEVLRPLLGSAVGLGLRPRRKSGARSNAEQGMLYLKYQQALAAWRRDGKVGPPPLPAAPPGASAHNYALCPQSTAHVIGPNPVCPVCAAVPRSASLALDVMLLDSAGHPIGSGGGKPLTLRPSAWQQWAVTVSAFPALRDGGTFSSPDPVHVEFARWDHHAQVLLP